MLDDVADLIRKLKLNRSKSYGLLHIDALKYRCRNREAASRLTALARRREGEIGLGFLFPACYYCGYGVVVWCWLAGGAEAVKPTQQQHLVLLPPAGEWCSDVAHSLEFRCPLR